MSEPERLRRLSVRELKAELVALNVALDGLVEKDDLVQALLGAKGVMADDAPAFSSSS